MRHGPAGGDTMARMLDRESRIRVAGVAALAAAVMGGVVASALLFRGQRSAADSEVPPLSAGQRPYGPARPDKAHEMPAGCEADPASPPAVVFDLPEDLLDLGSAKQNVVIERDVTVRNIGSGVLCVPDVETGCGCVKAELLGDNRIAPAGTGKIHVKVDTAHREGRQEKSVNLTTNDPKRKTASFKVRLDVRLGIVVATGAGSTYFGRHAPGKPGEITIRLKSPKDDPEWTVTAVEGARTKFTWSVKRVEPEDPVFRDYDLTVVHPGAGEANLYNEDLKIATTHPDRPQIVVPTQMIVVTKYYAGPPSVSFGFVGGDTAPQARQVLVMAGEADTGFVLKGARVEGDGFSAKDPVRVKDGWAVEVSYDGRERKAGPLKAALIVAVDDAEMPTVKVPLHATVRGAPVRGTAVREPAARGDGAPQREVR